jgi:hypothetical protein
MSNLELEFAPETEIRALRSWRHKLEWRPISVREVP